MLITFENAMKNAQECAGLAKDGSQTVEKQQVYATLAVAYANMAIALNTKGEK